MKRGLAIILMLILIPSVYATITLDSVEPSSLNLGDKLSVSGSVTLDYDTFAILKLVLVCQDNETPLLTRSLSLKAGQASLISESLYPPTNAEGSCNIKAMLIVNSKVIESVNSNSLTITKDLNSEFNVPDTDLQLGDDLIVGGSITRLNGAKINGFGSLYLRSGGNVSFADSVEVKNGEFSYKRSTKDMPSGSYQLQFEVQDSYGNKELFDVATLDILNSLKVSGKLVKEVLNPGEKLIVEGSALRSDDSKAGSGTIVAVFDNKSYGDIISKGSFKVVIPLASDIKTGEHLVDVTVMDEDGNTGGVFLKASVNAIPTTLKLDMVNTELSPKGVVKVKSELFDQAGDFIETKVFVEIENANSKRMFYDEINTGEELQLELPFDSAPGEWSVSSEYSGLEIEIKFNVNENLALNYVVEGQKLYVTNVGNIKVKEPLEISFSGAMETTKTKKLSLDVNETSEIFLGTGLITGYYEINIGDKIFNDIYLEKTRDYSWIYWIITAALVLLLLHIGFNYLKLGQIKQWHNREVEKGKQTSKNIFERKKVEEAKSKETKRPFNEGVKEFRDRILADVRKRDREETKDRMRDQFKKDFMNK
ncbi:MAG: hypothetical protein Q8R00_04425 [Candidatus Nanoarchaeia archaeon]|nr:hypothetical protein [Candidatus Nanoarchaeia archaeon]